MADELKMLDELEALEKKATPPPWTVSADDFHCAVKIGGGYVPAPYQKPYGRGRCPVNEADGHIIAAARNALLTLLRLARRGLEADAAAQRAERAEAELEKMREMFNARGEVCTAVRSGISAMQNGTARDALVAEAETYAALNRLMALEKQDADLSPAPAPGSVTEGFEALRRIAGDDLPEPDMPDAGGAA